MESIASPYGDTDTEQSKHRACVALTAFAHAVGESLEDDPEANLIDLLTDLHHWADANDVDWIQAASFGDFHYVNEAN